MPQMINTRRFGNLELEQEHLVHFKDGLIGFSDLKTFCVIDPGDETILLWLQSIENPALCFPVIEPKLIDPHYAIKLSETEKESLGIENLSQTMIFSILTIPENLTLSTANLRAPLVIHLVTHEARQIILQDVNRDIRHPAYKALRTCVDLYGSEDLRKTAAKALPIKETKNFRAFSESLSL